MKRSLLFLNVFSFSEVVAVDTVMNADVYTSTSRPRFVPRPETKFNTNTTACVLIGVVCRVAEVLMKMRQLIGCNCFFFLVGLDPSGVPFGQP
jgi:hypothetical protein